MRFLADENFFTTSVRLLRAAGHDVAAAAKTRPATMTNVYWPALPGKGESCSPSTRIMGS